MADFDLKSITADTDGPSADTELLFGSPDQSSGTPKPYSFAGIKTWVQGWLTKAMVGLGNVANSLQLVAANNLSDLVNLVTARANLQVSFGQAQNRVYVYTDLIGTPVLSDAWIARASGTGTGFTPVTVGSLNASGIVSLDLGTTLGQTAIWSGTGGGPAVNVVLGLGRTRFQSKCAIHTLSNGTDTYTTRVGLIDSPSGESTDGVFFRYTDGVNSGKWQAVTRSNGTEAATDTGVTPVADTWHLMTIDVNAAGTSVVFSIDGSTVATNTTFIPTGTGRETGYGCMAIKSAGTTATSGGYFDFMEFEQIFTTPR